MLREFQQPRIFTASVEIQLRIWDSVGATVIYGNNGITVIKTPSIAGIISAMFQLLYLTISLLQPLACIIITFLHSCHFKWYCGDFSDAEVIEFIAFEVLKAKSLLDECS